MEKETEKRKAVALFMAFGTQGDVYPIAAIAAAFASDQKQQYNVVLVTHSAHENLSSHLRESCVTFLPINSPPVLSATKNDEIGFSLQKRNIIRTQRHECYLAFERIFGPGPSVDGDCVVINLFALEGWSLAELFHIPCCVAAPYVVPYSAPSSFERQFKKEFPILYKYLQEAPMGKVCWKDVFHWMWPLFTENWGSWRRDDLNLSPCPFTDPVTGMPTWHDWPSSPLLLYGFSKEIVECPDYWPSNVCVSGFWFLPLEWQFSCKQCAEISALVSTGSMHTTEEYCPAHLEMQSFLTSTSVPPVFIGLSTVGSMGFLGNPQAFLQVIETVLEITNHRFILLTAGYEPLNKAIQVIAAETKCSNQMLSNKECSLLFDGRLFCFTGMIPYKSLFPRCAAVIHHGGSGSTAAALYAGTPQVVCPFILDQFYWAEKMHWLGVSPAPVKRNHLIPDKLDPMSIRIAANMLSKAIGDALFVKVKARALEIAEILSHEDGVKEAVEVLKREFVSQNRTL